MLTTAIPPTPSLSHAGLAALPGTWMRAPDGRRFVQVTVPRRFGLHPIDEHDPRFYFWRGAPTLAVHAGPRAWTAGHCWFSYAGTELYGLVNVWMASGGRLIVDVARVAVA
jgi:hypothetical protein